MVPSMKGACLCGGVQFCVKGEPEVVFICYCTHCSKNAGATGQISAKFKKEHVELKQHPELLKTWILKDNLSGNEKHKVFCSQCGCTLWTIPMKHGGSHFIVRTSLLEDGLSRLPYKVEFFASRKVDVAADHVKSFETMPGH
ncbi:Mss4-like protein [Penicillium longicatenatum]|uniref:Mss4-like protein n=1 Tax=Penicillium longicatenatum TaxID=1561947 RepID=UPI0025492D91|nr:Mss4-like protein [Penicillium longicatenatum]KAJ5636951.1 Mss4-like protein [Penicillium longicatenatum]